MIPTTESPVDLDYIANALDMLPYNLSEFISALTPTVRLWFRNAFDALRTPENLGEFLKGTAFEKLHYNATRVFFKALYSQKWHVSLKEYILWRTVVMLREYGPVRRNLQASQIRNLHALNIAHSESQKREPLSDSDTQKERRAAKRRASHAAIEGLDKVYPSLSDEHAVPPGSALPAPDFTERTIEKGACPRMELQKVVRGIDGLGTRMLMLDLEDDEDVAATVAWTRMLEHGDE